MENQLVLLQVQYLQDLLSEGQKVLLKNDQRSIDAAVVTEVYRCSTNRYPDGKVCDEFYSIVFKDPKFNRPFRVLAAEVLTPQAVERIKFIETTDAIVIDTAAC